MPIKSTESLSSTLVVEGGHKLNGRIDVEGNKNSALPLLAACLLTDQVCELTNVPRIKDVDVMVELLSGLGAGIERKGPTTLSVHCATVSTDEPDPGLVGRLRGSVLLVGPLLARVGRVRLAPPGGDFPARRTLSVHLQALEEMGVKERDGSGHALDAGDGLTAASFYLDEASVTGTETAVLAAAAAKGVSEIRHAASEPHVVELCQFLSAMGVEIEGAGTSTLKVHGGSKLIGASHQLKGDYIEAGSWAVIGAITGGEVEVCGARASDLEPIVRVLERLKLECNSNDDRLTVSRSKLEGCRQITTAPWPAFPSDMVSLVTVLATQAEGRTLIHDWMYELRLFALEQLSGMGANLFLCDPHRIIVDGPSALSGRNLDTRDLRSGMALIAAGLAGTGVSRIGPLETVERGYGNVVARLRSLGAQVSVE
ncbi:MAG: UDP-N-acetylglucosamine 1-carboxyvinyltransferase [Acidobacteriota bacterium]|nr:UDP-N-acetylglucosamine 1-carboxyvinyltransferase [Acidobacteriota bacterium]